MGQLSEGSSPSSGSGVPGVAATTYRNLSASSITTPHPPPRAAYVGALPRFGALSRARHTICSPSLVVGFKTASPHSLNESNPGIIIESAADAGRIRLPPAIHQRIGSDIPCPGRHGSSPATFAATSAMRNAALRPCAQRPTASDGALAGTQTAAFRPIDSRICRPVRR